MKNEPFRVVWNTEDCCDGFECDTFEEAEARAWDIYDGWAEAGYYELTRGDFSEEAIEDWNRMISECYVEIYEYDAETGEYEECWSPSEEDFEKVGPYGWYELTTLEDLFNKINKGGNCDV